MRVALCTPWSRRSAIARTSRSLADGLSRHVDVTVYYPKVEDPLAPTTATVPGLHPERHIPELARFDHVLHVVGDHPSHAIVRSTAARLPGTVVLHDLSLARLAWSEAAAAGGIEAWLRLVTAWHGAGLAMQARVALEAKARWEREPVDPARIHFLPWVLSGCRAALVGSTWAARRLADDPEVGAAVHPVPLASPRLGTSLPARRRDDLVVVVVDRDAEDRSRLARRLAEHVGRVRSTDVVIVDPAADLLWQLRAAAVVVDLAAPALGTGAPTVLEALAHGCPTIVPEHGALSAFPDDVVVKVPDADSDALAASLLELLATPSRRRALSDAARAYVRERHDPSLVAEQTISALEEVERHQPVRDLVRQLGTVLAPLVATPLDPLARTIGATADELFGRTFDGPVVPLPPSEGALP